MTKSQKGNHSLTTTQDNYYDGLSSGCFDERFVSLEMRSGTKDCIQYIDENIDDEVLWLKRNVLNTKFYREPFKPNK